MPSGTSILLNSPSPYAYRHLFNPYLLCCNQPNTVSRLGLNNNIVVKCGNLLETPYMAVGAYMYIELSRTCLTKPVNSRGIGDKPSAKSGFRRSNHHDCRRIIREKSLPLCHRRATPPSRHRRNVATIRCTHATLECGPPSFFT